MLPSLFVIQLTITASLGGCLFGYDLGAISVTLPQLAKTFDLDDNQKELVVSILYVGGIVGAVCGGSLCDKIGRKITIILTDIIFMIGALWLYFASSYTQVVTGRFVVGVGVSISGVADVSYLHECAPVEWRGSVVSVNEACISLGFLLAYTAGFVYSNHEEEEWRIIFGLAGFLAAIQLIGMLILPESPAWLTETGQFELARKASERINNTDTAGSQEGNEVLSSVLEEPTALSIRQRSRSRKHSFDGVEVNSINSSLQDEYGTDPSIVTIPGGKKEGTDSFESESSFTMQSATKSNNMTDQRCIGFRHKLQTVVLTLSRYRRQVYIALYLAVVQQFCGQTNILNYAPLIFSEATTKDNENRNEDVGGEAQDLSMVIIGLVKFVVTVLIIWRIEYIGRRVLLILGNLLIATGLLALIIAFGGSSNASNDDDTWSPLTNVKTFHLALPGVLLVVCGYSISFGPLTWLLTSEMFPTDIRGRALGASTIVTQMCGAIATQTFLLSRSTLGPSSVFGIYCIITLFGVFFAFMAIPDTGEKSVEQIDESLNRMQWWKYGSIVLPQNDPVLRLEMSDNSSRMSEHRLS